MNKKTIDHYLQTHALKTIWQSPFEDEQFIVEMKLISDKDGDINETKEFGRFIPLPTQGDDYLIYMLGGNLPSQFGLPESLETWVSLAEWTNDSNFTLKAYNQHGVLVPYRNIFYYLEYDGNILFAILDDGTLPYRVSHEPLYFHFRTPQFLTNTSKIAQDKKQYVLSERTTALGPSAIFQQEFFLRNKNVKRFPMAFLSGKPQQVFDNVPMKKSVDLYDDGSIFHREYHRVSDLTFYQSILDKQNKYLVLPTGLDGSRVVYRDDVEIYLVRITPEAIQASREAHPDAPNLVDIMDRAEVLDGCYYHRNKEDSIRMVSHQSYGLPVDYVHAAIHHHDPQNHFDQWYIKIYFRESGLKRSLIAERHRLQALVHLPYEDQLAAMTGSETSLGIWRAEKLEMSAYNYLMRAYAEEVTPDKIIEAYGYDQIGLALANPNVTITKRPDQSFFSIPVMLIDKATVYEYNQFGEMLGWFHVTDCNRYLPSSEEAIFIEVFAGHGDSNPDIRIDPESIERQEMVSWRFYKAPIQKGTVQYGMMVDVTVDTDYVTRDDTHIRLTLDKDRYQLIGLSDERFLSKTIILDANTDGVYDFVVTYGETREIFPIPPAKIAVWVNGVSLIEGIDFHVDFPRIVIVGQEKLNVTKENPEVAVTYRLMGYPSADMTRPPIAEVGFVTDGKLSVNNRYDIHQNKISRVIIDGGVYNPNLFDFGAVYGEAPVPGIANGRPFSIDRHFISLRGLGGHDEVYRLIEQDRKDNKEIEDYMTAKLVREEPIVTDEVDYKYSVYSPFMSAITHHLLLEPGRYKKVNYRDPATIEQMVKNFKYLLKCDPGALNIDENRVWIAPFPYAISERIVVHHRLLKILEAINALYLNNRVPVHRWFSTTRTRQEDQ